MTEGSSTPVWLGRAALPLLLAAITLAYLPSLSGGFLNWDDPWLVQDNARLQRATLGDLKAIWLDLSVSTRLGLGAEYLPLRDTSHFVESKLLGLRPGLLRVVNLGLYLGAVALLRRALLASTTNRWGAEVAAWVFGLHAAHVESVAWIAGRKDVLALLFVAAAADVYARRTRHHVAWTAAWMSLALLSKSMSAATVGLLPLLDVAARRRPSARALGAAAAAVLVVLPVHLLVGQRVGMTTPLAGGSVVGALSTMGPVWGRYLAATVWPGALSIVHEVPTRVRPDAGSIAGWAVLLVGGLVAAVRWRRGASRTEALVWLAFVVPLLPVSQVVAPLQNRMADRYLWLSVLAPGIALAGLRWKHPVSGTALALVFVAVQLVGTIQRADLFASSERVFADAMRKSPTSAIATYQLGMAHDERGELDAAAAAYEETWRRYERVLREHPLDAPRASEPARRATNNLARLHARRGEWEEAERVLRRGLERFASDPKMVDNLNRVLSRRDVTAR